jgi:AsmA protein
MRYAKYALYAAAVVVLLVLASAALFIATFDPNDYRPQIVELVKEKTGRDLAIGDIGLKFFPKIGARLEQVSLAQRGGGGEFAGVTEVSVYVALLPLLSREVVVDEVRIDGLRAGLVKRADGTTNYDDLAQPAATPAQPPADEKEATPAQPVRLEVQGVRVTNARVTWKDETNGNDLAVEVAELRTGRISEKQPVEVELSAALRGVQPKADVRTQLRGTVDFDLQAQRFHVAGLDLKLDGSAMDFQGIALALGGDVEALASEQRVAVSGLKLDAKAKRGGDAYEVKLTAPAIESTAKALTIDDLTVSATGTAAGMQLTRSTVRVPGLQVNLAESRVLLDRLSLTANARSGGDAIRIELNAPKLDVTPQRASGESAQLSVKIEGRLRNGNLALRLSGVEGSAKALRIGAATLALDLRQPDNAVKGELATPVTGNLETRVFELPKIAGEFAVSAPQLPKGTIKLPLNGLVRADLGKERIVADLTTRFDESNIKAKGGVTGFGKPAIDFDVVIDKLDVDRYLPPKTAQAEAPAKPGGQAQKEEPIDLSALKPLDLKGALRVGWLKASNVKATNVRVDLRARDGRLTVDPLAANLYEGSTKGTVSVDANVNRFAVKQNLTGISIGPLLRDAANQDILEGRGSVALDVTTQGNVVSAMKRALNGSAQLVLRDGAVKGVDLAGAVRGLKSAFGAGDVEGSGSSKQKTDFSELSASFTINKGVAHNDDLSLKSPFIRVTGSGDVDIPANKLDYVVKTSVVASMSGQGGRELGDLKGLTVPVRVAGPFDQLNYKVEFSQMVRGTSKEDLKAGAAALQESARGQLQGLLGGKEEATAEQGAAGEQAQELTPKKKKKKEEDELKKALKGLLK